MSAPYISSAVPNLAEGATCCSGAVPGVKRRSWMSSIRAPARCEQLGGGAVRSSTRTAGKFMEMAGPADLGGLRRCHGRQRCSIDDRSTDTDPCATRCRRGLRLAGTLLAVIIAEIQIFQHELLQPSPFPFLFSLKVTQRCTRGFWPRMPSMAPIRDALYWNSESSLQRLEIVGARRAPLSHNRLESHSDEVGRNRAMKWSDKSGIVCFYRSYDLG